MGNKMKKYILSLLAVGSQGADFTGDTDASCNLLDATCDHTGFTITFDTACQASDYKAVQWDELYADGWAQQDSNTNLYGSASTAASECRFQDNAGVIEMKFNFKQCGTDHRESKFASKSAARATETPRFHSKRATLRATKSTRRRTMKTDSTGPMTRQTWE